MIKKWNDWDIKLINSKETMIGKILDNDAINSNKRSKKQRRTSTKSLNENIKWLKQYYQYFNQWLSKNPFYIHEINTDYSTGHDKNPESLIKPVAE